MESQEFLQEEHKGIKVVAGYVKAKATGWLMQDWCQARTTSRRRGVRLEAEKGKGMIRSSEASGRNIAPVNIWL